MADIIKEFYKQSNPLFDNTIHNAFTNNATTTKIIKNINLQCFGGSHSIDLFVDNTPVYANLKIPSDGSLKLENENLVVGPSSTLSYKLKPCLNETTFRAASEYTITGTPFMVYIDRNNMGILASYNNGVDLYVNGNIYNIPSIVGSYFYATVNFSSDIYETDTHIYIGYIYAHSSTYSNYYCIISIPKNTYVPVSIYTKSFGNRQDSNTNVHKGTFKFKENPYNGLLYAICGVYNMTTFDLISIDIGTYIYAAYPQSLAYSGVTTGYWQMDFAFFDEDTILVVTDYNIYMKYVLSTNSLTNGTLSLSANLGSDYKKLLITLPNNTIAIRTGTTSGVIDLLDNTLTVTSSSINTYYGILLTPDNTILGYSSTSDYELLNLTDLSIIQSKFTGTPIGLITSHPMYAVTTSYTSGTTIIDHATGKLVGTKQSNKPQFKLSTYYNTIIKIDGVEVTDA